MYIIIQSLLEKNIRINFENKEKNLPEIILSGIVLFTSGKNVLCSIFSKLERVVK
jgi:hypothetical protein